MEALPSRLGPHDVGFDLVDPAQGFAQQVEMGVEPRPTGCETCDTLGDQAGIEPVVLGASQLVLGERPDLPGLEQDHMQARRTQSGQDRPLVAARRLDPDR